MRYLLTASLLAALLSSASAEAPADAAPDAEQLSRDMISGLDGWLGRLNDKLQSDKPVSEEDFDSLFGESFLSGSQDPSRDIDLAEDRLNEKSGGDKRINDGYGKWLEKKLSPADLAPEVARSARRVAVNLKTPGIPFDSLKVAVGRGRIRISYPQVLTRRELQSDGTVHTSTSALRRFHVMAVPEDADPGKYRVAGRKGGVSVIFDRLRKGKKRTEASK